MSKELIYRCDSCGEIKPREQLYGLQDRNRYEKTLVPPELIDGAHVCTACVTLAQFGVPAKRRTGSS